LAAAGAPAACARGVAHRPLHSGDQYDFALVVMLTLLGLRIFEATGLLGMGTALALAASPGGDTVPSRLR
jgi:hypothetical protein